MLGCTSPGETAAVERSREVRLALADPGRAVRRRAMIDLFYTPTWVAHHGYPKIPTHLLGDPAITPQDANRHLLASAQHDAARRLHLITAPTLVLHGACDRMAPPQNAYAIQERIPHSRLLIHPTGRHGFFDEFAEEVTGVVTRFLQERVE